VPLIVVGRPAAAECNNSRALQGIGAGEWKVWLSLEPACAAASMHQP
jgi:hypothetical protein